MVTSTLTSCHLSINLDDLGGAKIIRLPLFFIFSRQIGYPSYMLPDVTVSGEIYR